MVTVKPWRCRNCNSVLGFSLDSAVLLLHGELVFGAVSVTCSGCGRVRRWIEIKRCNVDQKAMAAVARAVIAGLERLEADNALPPEAVIGEVDKIGQTYDTVLTSDQRGRLQHLRLLSLEAQGQIVA